MSKTKKLVPKRRFKKFIITKEWQQVKLGDVSEIIGGGTPSTNISAFWSGDIDWYSPTEIGNKIYVSQSEKKITQLGLSKSSAKILPIGTILYTSRAGIGNTAILAKEAATNQGFQSIVPKQDKLHSYFIYSRTKELKRYGEAKGSGSTFKEISGKQLAKMPISLPPLNEQILIGEFFKKLDALMQTQQKKLEKTKTLKLAYLAEMFPCDGESKPKLRFKNFDKIWNSTFLGLISQIKTGESDAQDSVAYGKYPFFVRSENIERSNRYLFDGEAILIPGEGRLGEIFHYINGKFDYHQRVYKISNFSNNIDGKFIFYLMQKDFKEHALKYTVKATVDSLRLPMLTNYRLKQPILQEQNKISSFFVKLDKKIALEQRKLEKLNNIKQAYLNEMFV